MPATLVLHPPNRPSRFVLLADGEEVVVGRDHDVDLILDDPRVSKRHARLRGAHPGAAWRLEDLQSKNGTAVNGERIDSAALADGDWVSFGGLIAQFATVSAEAASHLQQDRVRRLQTCLDLRRRLAAAPDRGDLLLGYLRGAIELTGTERGFIVIVGAGGTLDVVALAGYSDGGAARPAFEGSVGAVEQVLRTGDAVVLSDVQRDSTIGRRRSVVDQGLSALACVPLGRDDPPQGVLYVDGRLRAEGLTTLDVDILEALAEQAGLALAGLRVEARIRELLRPSDGSQDAPAAALRDALRARAWAAGARGGPATSIP
jgi:pSer/pThr/pTyr-binding forkhead associated (FHA) protein